MRLIPSHPLAKVLQGILLDDMNVPELRIDCAAGETVSAQAVLLPGATADTVTAQVSVLTTADGAHAIQPDAIHLQWVRYVHISKNSQGIPQDEFIGIAPLDIPDPFWEENERPIEPDKLQPLWIEIELPVNTAAGSYTGELIVAGQESTYRLPLSLHVRNFRLPAERHQHVIFWWNFPGRGFEQLHPDSQAYWQHLNRTLAVLRWHRITDIRGTDSYAGWELIEQKTADGRRCWDTAPFEKFAQTCFDAGMRAIHLPFLAQYDKFQMLPDSRPHAIESQFEKLAVIDAVVVTHGWQGRVLVSITDEPFLYQEKEYDALIERVRKTAPHIPIIDALETDGIRNLDVYVPKLTHLNLWIDQFLKLKQQGKEVWFYTAGNPVGRYPNRFLEQPLIETRELHWISYLYGFDGYLHWGLNRFNPDANPYTEAGFDFPPWPHGDPQIMYPGKRGFVGSIRLSAHRDGLQDYEYLWMLEDRLRNLKTRLGKDGEWINPRQRSLELCRRVVQSCYYHTHDPNVLFDTRAAIADEIEGLEAKPLLYVQTSPPEGTETPLGPVVINIRGITTPGAKLIVNGEPVPPQNIHPSGCFVAMIHADNGVPEITVTAEHDGSARTIKRSFRVVD